MAKGIQFSDIPVAVTLTSDYSVMGAGKDTVVKRASLTTIKNWLVQTITTDHIKQGATHLFMTVQNLNKWFLGKSTDDLKQGVENKYLTDENLSQTKLAEEIRSHIANVCNSHKVTRDQLGLDKVENISLSTWKGSEVLQVNASQVVGLEELITSLIKKHNGEP